MSGEPFETRAEDHWEDHWHDETPREDIDEFIATYFPGGASYFPLRRCSACSEWVGYRTNGTWLFFDSNCGCTTDRSRPQRRPWSDLKDLVAEED